MADYSDPKRGTAFRFTMSLFAQSDNQIKTSPTLAAGDVKVSKDNGATANITTLPAETPASSGILQVDLSASEMTADLVTVVFVDAAGDEWNSAVVNIAPGVRQMADLAYPTTSGRSIDVDANGGVEVGSFQTGAITASAFTAGALDAAALAADAGTEIGTAVWASATRTLTANTNLNDLNAAGIRSAIGLASANLDTQLTAIDDYLDTEVAAIKAKTDNLPASPAATSDIPSAATIADAVWDEAIAGHVAAGSTGEALGAAGAAGDPWTTSLPGAYAAGQAGYIIGTNLNATVSSRASQTSVDTVDDFLDTEIAAIKAKTDNLPSDPADASDIASSFATVNSTLSTIAGYIDTEVAAIKAKTDSLTFTVAGVLDANVLRVGGTVQTAGDIIGDTNDIQTRLPAALVSGRIDASVGAMAANVMTAAAAASDLTTELQTGLATAAAVAALPTAATIADAVWDEDATAHQTLGTFGQAIGDPGADSDTIWSLVNTNLNATISSRASQTSLDTVDDFLDTEIATIVSQTAASAIRSAVGLASANLDTQIATLATASSLATVAGYLDTEVAAILAAVDTEVTAIKAKTDSLTFTVAGVVDANTLRVGGTVQTAGDIIADTNDIQARLPAALVSGRMDASVGAMAANVLTATAIAADAITDAKVASDVTIASVTGSVGSVAAGGITASSIAADAIGASELAADAVTEIATGVWAAAARTLTALDEDSTTLDLDATIRSAVGLASANLDTQIDALPTNAELATALAAADDAVLAAIAALNNLSAAQVNAEVVDALNVDTYAEPGQGAPGATISLAAKLNYLYKALRNKSTVTATEHSIFADDGVTVDHKRSISDNGTTFESTELGAGP